jgi:hypothetical protein
VKLDPNGNLVPWTGTGTCVSTNKERFCTVGPLNRRDIEAGQISSSIVPLIADTAPGAGAEAVLSAELGEELRAGVRLGEAFTDGPVLNTTMNPPVFTVGTPQGGAGGWWATWNKGTLQDYRDFGAVHGAAEKHCNMLMGDASVRAFKDPNRDGFINNGFNPALYTGPGSIGYLSADLEVEPTDLFSGYNLKASNKGNLDRQ